MWNIWAFFGQMVIDLRPGKVATVKLRNCLPKEDDWYAEVPVWVQSSDR